MAMLFRKLGQDDSVIYFAKQALQLGRRSLQKPTMLEASTTLSAFYIEKRQLDSALKYQQLMMTLKDSLFGPEKIRRLQLFAINEQKRLHEVEQKQLKIEQDQKDYKNNFRFYGLLGALSVFILIGFILYRNNRRQKTANVLLQQQKKQIETTLTELRATQTQLIQSEKMASLGELTAGIAHEIQNPLNFVNNFSEVNDELLKELKTEAEKGNFEEVKAIAKDIGFNSEKINHHGKRAEAIVKGMLQHSRTSSGQKELTDINALADEYLRLAYYGLRAKDNSFNATMKTDFDESVGKINVVPQEIGRVILNLINNAFYAVDEKKKSPHPLKGSEEYEPVVTVSTKRLGPPLGDRGKPDSYWVEITVADNGNGIPQKVMDKIFQPFFTTKPTGQGTGLGLSLSYDIVKAHGGELKVETKEGEGTSFIVVLAK
jgi:signal transduction histidine kinase